jgi:Cu/Zn superoxide dismutase
VSPLVEASGELADLAPSTADATDGAWADAWAVTDSSSTYVVLLLSGLDPAAEGTTYGAHVHVGPCVPGNGAAAGPHYNAGGTPTLETEVWLDFEVLPWGYAYALASVPFQIQEGAAQSIVIHAEPTQDGGSTPGAAGARLACLPLAF